MATENQTNHFLLTKVKHTQSRNQNHESLYDLECRLVEDVCAKLKKAGVTFETEVKIGSAVRADIVGRNWVCEAKINCSSTSMISAIAQALIYKKNLNKSFVCLLLPSDQEPSEFFKKECNDFGIDLVSEATLTDWVRQKQNEA